MKKALGTITVFFYFIVSCGVAVNIHYCMGSFQSIGVYAVKNDKCGKCGMHMEDNNSCCKDELKIIKLQNDQNKVNIHYALQSLAPALTSTSGFITASLFNLKKSIPYSSHSPPLITAQDTYLQNCVFRI